MLFELRSERVNHKFHNHNFRALLSKDVTTRFESKFLIGSTSCPITRNVRLTISGVYQPIRFDEIVIPMITIAVVCSSSVYVQPPDAMVLDIHQENTQHTGGEQA